MNEELMRMQMSMEAPSIMGVSYSEDSYLDAKNNKLYIKGTSGWQVASTEGEDNPMAQFSALLSSGEGDAQAAVGSTSIASLLALCKEVNTTGREEYNGVRCYVVDMVLNPETFMTLMSMGLAGSGVSASDMDEEDKALLEKMVEEISMTAYIGTSDGLIHGYKMDFGEAFASIIMQEQTEDMDISKMEFSMSATMDYKENTLSLPAETKDAAETEYDTLVQNSMLFSSMFSSASDSSSGSGSSSGNWADSELFFSEGKVIEDVKTGKDAKAVNTISKDTKSIGVVVNAENVDEPVIVTFACLIDNGTSVSADTSSITKTNKATVVAVSDKTIEKDGYVIVEIEQPKEGWQAGQYRIELFGYTSEQKDTTVELGIADTNLNFTVE